MRSNLVSLLERFQFLTAVTNSRDVNNAFMVDVANGVREATHWFQACLANDNGRGERFLGNEVDDENQFISKLLQQGLSLFGVPVSRFVNILK